MRAAFSFMAGALLLASSATASAQAPGASTELKAPGGETVGTATFEETSDGVQIRAQVRGLPPGEHGIHIHEVGQCEPPDFMSAGRHFNPTSAEHGLENPAGPHAGDMPNLEIADDGTGTLEYTLEDVTLGSGENSLLKPDGTALVIHASADDQVTDPSGDSGSRIACGVIARSGTAAQGAPAAQPSPATTPATRAPAISPTAPVQTPRAIASPSALPDTGSAPLPVHASLPAVLAGLAAVVAGLAIWRRRT